MRKQYSNYESARKFVRKLKLKSRTEWLEYSKSNRPENIPANPNRTYKTKGWISWGDFLGTGSISSQLKQYQSFTEARNFVQKLGFKSNRSWLEYCKSGNKPEDIPRNPQQTYKNEWSGWGDFLGTGSIAPKDRVYRPFKEAREFVRNLGLKHIRKWYEYCKSGNKPENIPANPEKVYKNEFNGIGDWLGTGSIAPKDRVYRPFKEAREFVRNLGLKTAQDWIDYCKSGNKPEDIPATPWIVYKEWSKK